MRKTLKFRWEEFPAPWGSFPSDSPQGFLTAAGVSRGAPGRVFRDPCALCAGDAGSPDGGPGGCGRHPQGALGVRIVRGWWFPSSTVTRWLL